MRGEDFLSAPALSSGGWITPACAGKTQKNAGSSYTNQDHPRMRGEDYSRICGVQVFIGSPPHARGRRSYVKR